jgi:hypothetical protein
MKFEIVEIQEDPDSNQKYLDAVYASETSFNCVFSRDGKAIAFARGEKIPDGLRYTMFRGLAQYKGMKLEDLKDCDVEVISRTLAITLRTLKLDSLYRTVICGPLKVEGKIF